MLLVNSGTLPVQEALSTLSAAGTCRLAPSIPGLSPYQEREGIPAAALPSMQRCYVRSATAHQSQPLAGGAYVTTCNLPVEEGNATVTKSVPFSAELQVTQAPAVFAMPALSKRKFHTPFKCTLTIIFGAPLRFTAGVRVYSIDEVAVARMPSWAPAGKPSEQLSGGELQQELRLVAISGEDDGSGEGNEAPGSGGKLFRASRDYVFPALAFNSPSSVRPRWLVFVVALPGGPLLLTHFLLPTIVMSRVAEQEEKAARLLWGDALPERGFSGWTLRDFGKYVRRELQVSPNGRELLPSDINALAVKAGFSVAASTAAGANASGGQAASDIAGGQYRAFQQYLHRTKRLLEAVRQQYERTQPTLICGFATGRHEAEEALCGHPPGTFLVRFASEGGGLAFSCVSATADGVEHVMLPQEDLDYVSLEEAIALCARTQHLLDVASGGRVPCHAVTERPVVPQRERREHPGKRARVGLDGLADPAAAAAAGIVPASAVGGMASGIPVALARPVEGLAPSRVGSLTEMPTGTVIGTGTDTGTGTGLKVLYHGAEPAAPAAGVGGDTASVPSSREGSRLVGNTEEIELTKVSLPAVGQVRLGSVVGGGGGGAAGPDGDALRRPLERGQPLSGSESLGVALPHLPNPAPL